MRRNISKMQTTCVTDAGDRRTSHRYSSECTVTGSNAGVQNGKMVGEDRNESSYFRDSEMDPPVDIPLKICAHIDHESVCHMS